MNELACSEERFLNDVFIHEMQIIRDDGVNRHLRFKKPGTSNMYFDLITWSGHLCYTGDMGTFVFSRIEDMFEFFRMDEAYRKKSHPDRKLIINPDYWHQKVEAENRHGGVEQYSEKAFIEAVKYDFQTYYEDVPDDDPEKLKCWEEIESSVLHFSDNEYSAFDALASFQYKEFEFVDFEYNTKEYSFHYVWCCYAIVWGIQQYDKRIKS